MVRAQKLLASVPDGRDAAWRPGPSLAGEEAIMSTADRLEPYRRAIRERVCVHCPERPPLGPPCAPQGKRCGMELHLEELVDLVHRTESARIDPYIDGFHDGICTHCANATTSQCPCPLEYLISLAISAIEEVDAPADLAPG